MFQMATGAFEELADLLVAHVKLAQLELSADLQLALGRMARLALFVVPLIVGYAFAMAALAACLATYCGRAGALGLIAALQVAVGGVGLHRTLAALRRTSILQRTSTELTSDAHQAMAALSSHREP